MSSRLYLVALLTGVVGVSSAPAMADTLREALVKAYGTNPTLTGARAGQRANDENVPIARARGLPGIDLSGSYSENIQRSTTTSPARQAAGQVALDVPLYQGGAVRNAVKAADARVDAGQETLRDTEASVFTAVVAAYMDVLRDEAIVQLNRKQVSVLQTNLQATRDRFEVGDLTRTDIAQSESRLAFAQSQLEAAEAQVIASKERYVQLVGSEPGTLQQPPPLPNLPATTELAVTTALEQNPNLKAAAKNQEAARYDVGSAKASRLPRVQAVANKSYANFLGSLDSFIPGFNTSQTSQNASAGVQITLPLFQGGGPSAQVRQAQARSSQAIEQTIEAERSVVAQTRTAFASWRASNANILSSEAAVAATALSLEGVRAENSVGTRSILDILNAEQEYLDAQVQLVTSRRNAYVAGFSLLAAMGQAEARDLGLDGGVLYDPEVNYKRVRNRIWDWDTDPKPSPVATRTVDTAAQSPAIRSELGATGK
jgi:outer membrane protein